MGDVQSLYDITIPRSSSSQWLARMPAPRTTPSYSKIEKSTHCVNMFELLCKSTVRKQRWSLHTMWSICAWEMNKKSCETARSGHRPMSKAIFIPGIMIHVSWPPTDTPSMVSPSISRAPVLDLPSFDCSKRDPAESLTTGSAIRSSICQCPQEWYHSYSIYSKLKGIHKLWKCTCSTADCLNRHLPILQNCYFTTVTGLICRCTRTSFSSGVMLYYRIHYVRKGYGL